jgi:hypothetical protein
MHKIRKTIIIIVAAALLLPILACGLDGVEYRPSEKVAEDLFNKGIGKPWVGGEPFKSTSYSETRHSFSPRPYTSYQIIGYLNVGNGFGISSDGGSSIQIQPSPGSYPVYGYYSGYNLRGIFIDLGGSGGMVQMYPYL